MSNSTSTSSQDSLLEFEGFTIPAGCRRIFITAELEPSNGDPRIQPTGFPDIGPVLYPDPSEKDGLICLIDGEAKVGQFLEEVCLKDQYQGTWRSELEGLPYIKLTRDGTKDGEFVTASTIDGHRFASEYIMGAQFAEITDDIRKAFEGQAAPRKEPATKKAGKKKATTPKPEFVLWVRHLLGMKSKDRCPATNVPIIQKIAMEYDPMALLHGFQISVKDKLTFVGLRSPRAIIGSIVGLGCQRISIPGVRFDPIGTAAAKQAIFQKQRISAQKIEARFSIDVGLLSSLHIGDGEQSSARLRLLLKIALCKVAWLIGEFQSGKRLRTECDLRLIEDGPKYWINRVESRGSAFPYEAIANAASKSLNIADRQLGFEMSRSPLVLKHAATQSKEENQTDNAEADSSDEDTDSVDSNE